MSTTAPITPMPEAAATRGFPAPLVFLLAFIVAAVLQRAVPLKPALPGVWGMVGLTIAILLLVAAAGIGPPALMVMRKAHTSPSPYRPVNALVIEGPFKFSRNPMYLSMVLMFAAAAILFGIVWMLVLLPLVILVLNVVVIGREERYMEAKFGQAYRDYRGQVRRWL